MFRFWTLRAALPLWALAVFAGCEADPVLPLAEVRDFTVANVQASCEGRAPVLAVDLTVQGYAPRDVLEDDSYLVVGPAVLPGSTHRLEVNLSVHADATPDGMVHEVRLVKPLRESGLTTGQAASLDVRKNLSGAPTDVYRTVQVIPTPCS